MFSSTKEENYTRVLIRVFVVLGQSRGEAPSGYDMWNVEDCVEKLENNQWMIRDCS